MKVALLAGGVGSRLAEETEIRPKPLVEIGGMPIIWHIMQHYSRYGFNEFAIALGYKGDDIRRWFYNYTTLGPNIRVNTGNGEVVNHDKHQTNWIVDLIETGLPTLTGGRIKRLRPWINNETFMLTWGDGVSDVDLDKLLAFHRSHGRIATMTAVRPTARFGHLEFNGDHVKKFTEKPQTSEGWINGAFFVLEPQVFDYIEGDMTQWEHEPMEQLAKDGQLMAYKHSSFWQCMDTLRDKNLLQKLWDEGNPPWKTWS